MWKSMRTITSSERANSGISGVERVEEPRGKGSYRRTSSKVLTTLYRVYKGCVSRTGDAAAERGPVT